MMYRSMKLLGSGEKEYFNEKRPVNVRVDGASRWHSTPRRVLPAPEVCGRIPLITVVLSERSATCNYPASGMLDIEAPSGTTTTDFQELQTTRVGVEPLGGIDST